MKKKSLVSIFKKHLGIPHSRHYSRIYNRKVNYEIDGIITETRRVSVIIGGKNDYIRQKAKIQSDFYIKKDLKDLGFRAYDIIKSREGHLHIYLAKYIKPKNIQVKKGYLQFTIQSNELVLHKGNEWQNKKIQLQNGSDKI